MNALKVLGSRAGRWVVAALALGGLVEQGLAQSDWSGGRKSKVRMLFGPVAGFTTKAHPAPREMVLPLGATVRFEVEHLKLDQWVEWDGSFDRQSAHEYRFFAPGPTVVRCTVQPDGERLECPILVCSIAPQDLDFSFSVDRRYSLDLHEDMTNAETVPVWFDPQSIGEVHQIGRSYAASVKTPIALRAQTDLGPSGAGLGDPGFDALIEWRVDSEALGVGSVALPNQQPGIHRVEVGPPSVPRSAQVMLYDVQIRGDYDGDRIPLEIPVTFTAVTHPAGFEPYVTWLASTKFGSAEPTLGQGPSFTTTFKDTAETFHWIGVRGDSEAAGFDGCPWEDRFFLDPRAVPEDYHPYIVQYSLADIPFVNVQKILMAAPINPSNPYMPTVDYGLAHDSASQKAVACFRRAGVYVVCICDSVTGLQFYVVIYVLCAPKDKPCPDCKGGTECAPNYPPKDTMCLTLVSDYNGAGGGKGDEAMADSAGFWDHEKCVASVEDAVKEILRAANYDPATGKCDKIKVIIDSHGNAGRFVLGDPNADPNNRIGNCGEWKTDLFTKAPPMGVKGCIQELVILACKVGKDDTAGKTGRNGPAMMKKLANALKTGTDKVTIRMYDKNMSISDKKGMITVGGMEVVVCSD